MGVLKVGVIGLGRMGQQHVRIYSGLRRVQLVGVSDINPETGMRVAQRYDVPFYESTEELLSRVDAVSIVTPTPFHFELAMQCLAKGVHILVEKPVTETLEQAETFVAAAESSSLTVQVGHIERFNPAYIELRNVLEDLNLLAVNMRRLSAYTGSNTDVNVILDLMIHDTDLALDLAGEEPVEVMASGISAFGSAVDHAVAQLVFPSGPVMTLTASRVTEEKVRAMEITAREAYVEANLLNKTVQVHRRSFGEYQGHNKRGIKYRQESILESIVVPIVEPLYSELQHFTDSVIDRKPVVVTPRQGMQALRLAIQICSALQARMVFPKVRETNLGIDVSQMNLSQTPA